MKLNRIITLCAMATLLAVSASSLLAQNNGGGPGGGGFGGGGPGGGGPGGGGRNRGGGGFGGGQGGGNFDPAAMAQRQLDRYQEQLEFTNTVEWEAVKPFVQKIIDAQMAARGGMMGGRGGRGGGMGGMAQANPEREALQKAIDDGAPAAQVKDLLGKYKASVKVKQAKLETAQEDLKKILNTRQEAMATLIGLVQ